MNKIVESRGSPHKWFAVDTDQGPAEVKVMEFPDLSFSFYCDLTKVLPPLEDPRNKHASITRVIVTMKTTIPEALIGLVQLYGALAHQRQSNNPGLRGFDLHLIIQTLPDQRADKITVPGEGMPAWSTGMLIGSIGFDSIIIHDVHSDVIHKALRVSSQRPVNHRNAIECFEKTLDRENMRPPGFGEYLVLPDKGAQDRVQHIIKKYCPKLIHCDKKRDTEGKIIGHQIIGITDQEGRPLGKPADPFNVWVIDDLCDGGATFISVAQLLDEEFATADRTLYVTHGLFSRGKKELLKHYNKVIALFDYSEE